MRDNKVFLDTNIWIYLLTTSQHAEDKRKKEVAQRMLLDYPNIVVSVQVFNELSNVWIRKYHIELKQVELYLRQIIEIVEINPLDEMLTFRALALLRNHNLSFYDSLIVASAIESDCCRLFSEDMQDGQWIENRLQICNPFTIIN